MAATTFTGVVRSQNGFETITKDATTGAVTVTASFNGGVVILTGLPTSDPMVAGQLWNNAGVLTVSAG